MSEYRYCPVEKVHNAIDISEIRKHEDIVFDYFMNNDIGLVVVCDKKHEKVHGVISLGDLLRGYLKGKKCDEIVNSNYSCLFNVDDSEAESFFDSNIRIFEIPVVLDNKYQGIYVRTGLRSDKRLFDLRRDLKKYRYDVKDELYQLRRIKEVFGEDNNLMVYYLGSNEHQKVMTKEQWKPFWEARKDHTDKEIWESFNGSWYGDDFYRDFESLQFGMKNGISKPQELKTKNFNVNEGTRRTANVPNNAKRKIYMFGPCTIFGAYCPDEETIESHLQYMMINNGIVEYEVVNMGLLGPQMSLNRLFSLDINSNDIIVVSLILGGEDTIASLFPKQYYGVMNDVFKDIDSIDKHVLRACTHCDGAVNLLMAERLFKDIQKVIDKAKTEDDFVVKYRGKDYFIPWEVQDYFKHYYFEKNKLSRVYNEKQTVGAIVMNANPFTKGHRYLIEYALKRVDELIVFVVQEDQSMFSFDDRLQMVRRGTEDLESVIVIPSGKYIISKDTFNQYFNKENHISEVESMDYDVRIFGEIVCKYLGINVRFLGEEPNDKVTLAYNKTISSILPEYGINVEVIARLETDGMVISATSARKLYNNKNWDGLNDICPSTTVEYLQGLNT